jgi:hypothetical protein
LVIQNQSKRKLDRLAVVTTGQDISKILGIPKLTNGTGEAQALSVFGLDVIQVAFHYTSSNTCIQKGATTILEQYIGRKLLYLACRHHVHELIVGATFEVSFGKTTLPEVALFVDFRKTWFSLERKVCLPLQKIQL